MTRAPPPPATRREPGACADLRHVVPTCLPEPCFRAAEEGLQYEIAWFTFWAPWYPALDALDFRRVIREHYAAVGLDVERFDERLSCYELGIGLDHIACFAFTGRDADQRAVARRIKRILERLSCGANVEAVSGPATEAQQPPSNGAPLTPRLLCRII